MPDLVSLGRLAEVEFPEIVVSMTVIRNKLRVVLIDGSYVDFWWSGQIPGRFAYHWERTSVHGTIYRHDNIPHLRWRSVGSFPKHFHSGEHCTVIESDMADDPEQGLRQFLGFVRGMTTRGHPNA